MVVKITMMLFTLLLISGCSLFSETKLGEKFKESVDRYCELPLADRNIMRQNVDSVIAPNSIRVECYRDTEDPW